jgi:nitrogen PTS system EIIA component
MTLAEILDPARIVVADQPVAAREDLLRLVADLLAGPGKPFAVPAATIFSALLAREQLVSTAVGSGVAFPHAKIDGLEAARAAVVILPEPGADLAAPDKAPVRLIVALVVPPDSVGEHLKMLGVFSRRLRDPQTRQALLAARAASAVLRLVGGIDVVPR